jgi:ubiquinone biosynthesis monooxygenase Coq7
MKSPRHYTFLDKLCLSFDQSIRALTNTVKTTSEPYPAEDFPLNQLDKDQQKTSARLMRINHAGEICAQALYHGQALVSRCKATEEKMLEAALEEGNHLKWCKKRLDELQSHTSYLNPFWYAGSFCIGMLAGMISDKWSLGFLAETERQVINHLEKHLSQLKINDPRSYKILRKMQEDEEKHHNEAVALGATQLPTFIQQGMKVTSKVMVKTSYWV